MEAGRRGYAGDLPPLETNLFFRWRLDDPNHVEISVEIRFCEQAVRRVHVMSHPDFQPTLVGPTIAIRPIASDDWPELYAAGSDPEIWKVHPVPNRYTEPEFRKFFDGALNSKMGFVFVDRANGRRIPLDWHRQKPDSFRRVEFSQVLASGSRCAAYPCRAISRF